ncbi:MULTISPECIES: methyltransferase [Nostocales]|uniref:Methyltransferase n=3 Tax=Nostocales TaxID=1161 RepID=A0A0C1QX14_9CYAN|nr:methyltransferase [Tolypothrix bouteillei]KAF3885889.1 methyltransferase [Tolypothrix bouteillei VB521301]
MTLSESTLTPRNTQFQLSAIEWVYAYWVSRCIYVVAKLGIADLLKDGSQHCDTLAVATETHSNSLYRVLRALASVGIFAETEPYCFQLTSQATCLQSDVPGSIRAEAILRGEEHYYKAWGNLMYSVQTGENAFEHLYGMNLFQYNDENPTQGHIFDRGMAESKDANADIMAAYDFSFINKLVDVGGGKGSLLTDILQAYPTMVGVLFDRPDVINRSQTFLSTAAMNARYQFVGGDFFETVPVGGDAYLLKHIIQDWDDRQALAILKRCHQAMNTQGRLLVIDFLIPPGNEFFASKFIDINMLVISPNGRIRSEAEFYQLFKAAGFKLTQIIPTKSEVSIIEGIKIVE